MKTLADDAQRIPHAEFRYVDLHNAIIELNLQYRSEIFIAVTRIEA